MKTFSTLFLIVATIVTAAACYLVVKKELISLEYDRMDLHEHSINLAEKRSEKLFAL